MWLLDLSVWQYISVQKRAKGSGVFLLWEEKDVVLAAGRCCFQEEAGQHGYRRYSHEIWFDWGKCRSPRNNASAAA